MKTKRIVSLSVLLAMAIVLAYVESLIPALPIPGSKLGLANIITLVVLYLYSEKDALTISLLRIFVVGLIRGTIGFPTFWLSLGGGILALVMMIIFKRLKIFNKVSVSIMGSLGHALGQILVAMVVLSTPELAYYFPFIFMIAIPTGIFTGLVAIRLTNLFIDTLQVT